MALIVVLGFGAVACGGGGPAAVAPLAAADTSSTTVDAAGAYSACLRDHGVDLPERQRAADGTGGPPSSRAPGDTPSSRPPGSRPSTSLPAGVDQTKIAAAREACQSLQPTDRGAVNGGQGQAFQAYTSCMKDHGVTVGGPGGPGGAGGAGGAGGPGGANRDDPAFKAADAICGVLRPAPSTTTPAR